MSAGEPRLAAAQYERRTCRGERTLNSMEPGWILNQLDQAARDYCFPMLDNGYVYPADVRLSIFRDTDRWLMIIEDLGVSNPRLCGCDVFQNALHLFGSGLRRPPGTSNSDFLFPISSLTEDPLFADPNDWDIRSEVHAVAIRGHRVTVDLSPAALARHGLTLLDPPQIDPVVLLRSLLPEWRDLLLASPEELSQRNHDGLPLWLSLEEWFHPDVGGGEVPSECETFRMLAAAIASGDPGAYRPSRAPNTHWKHWPAGGTL